MIVCVRINLLSVGYNVFRRLIVAVIFNSETQLIDVLDPESI